MPNIIILSLVTGFIVGYVYTKSYILQTNFLITSYSVHRLLILSCLRMLTFALVLYYLLRSQTVHLILFLGAFFLTIGYQLRYRSRRGANRSELENGTTYTDL